MKERKDKSKRAIFILTGIFIILASLAAGYFALIVSYSGPETSFIYIWPIFTVVFGLMAYYTATGLKRAEFNGMPRAVPTFIFTTFAIFAVIFSLLMGMVVRDSKGTREDEELSYVIVPGARVYADGISVTLKYRLDTALMYYREHPDVTLVLTGGQERTDAVGEAVAMFNYLSMNGVPSGSMIIEPEATSTTDNMRLSVAKIEEDIARRTATEPPGGMGLGRDPAGGAPSPAEPRRPEIGAPEPDAPGEEDGPQGFDIGSIGIGVISSDYHLMRCLKLMTACGINEPAGIPAPSDKILFVHQCVRESAAIMKDCLMGNLTFTKGDLPFELPFNPRKPRP